ncbi:hypothetical protein LXD69_07165 [Flavobacterium sediminilitoris]|uniref:Uncharacterized protein n=1 Tax=Flavobacterium sediminilitoris TaxID=2024526 RepID=A0ABY4HRH6_9FLAO|nr:MULTISPECIES: hypothetical protein [Flavobacterium]UOX35290.1 hypothetical protein LXD69_07165 [Flavobacterium sediminilitoris]
MEWIIQQHKRGNRQQEIQVSILVKSLNNFYAYNAQSWIDHFHNRLKEIPRSNSFSAEYGYKATPRNENSLEVWKMKMNGDYNYKSKDDQIKKIENTSNMLKILTNITAFNFGNLMNCQNVSIN